MDSSCQSLFANKNRISITSCLQGCLEELGVPRRNCDTCLQGRMRQKAFKGRSQHTEKLMERVQSDVIGSTFQSFRGNQYALTFVEEKSRKNFMRIFKSREKVARQRSWSDESSKNMAVALVNFRWGSRIPDKRSSKELHRGGSNS